MDKEKITSQQKRSMFLQMLEYKKISREIMEKNEDLVKENAMLRAVVDSSNQNKENSGNNQDGIDEMHSLSNGSKVASLNREVRRLVATICELEKSVARKELFEASADRAVPGRAIVEKNEVCVADPPSTSDEVYKGIVEEAGELQARLALLRSECKEELDYKQLEVDRLIHETRSYSSEAQESRERCKAIEEEVVEYRRKLSESKGENIKKKREMEICNTKIAGLEKSIEELNSILGLKEARISQLMIEKEEMNKLLDNYGNCGRRERPDGKIGDESFLEEEIGNLIESLDKSLSENKVLLKRLEETHGRNEKLEGVVISLKISNADFICQNSKLEADMEDLKRELKNCLNGKVDDKSLSIKKVDEGIDENGRLVSEYRKRLYKLSAEKEMVEKVLESNKKQTKELREDLSKKVKETYILEVENRKMNGIIKVMRGRAFEGDSDILAELERYRSLLRCPLCDSRFKNTAIAKCMHCFCEECVNVRVKMRDRKCPSCNESFSIGDIRKIYL